ncbi:hypothetical protein ACLBO9_29985, partial [Klebsiella pneumoniae]
RIPMMPDSRSMNLSNVVTHEMDFARQVSNEVVFLEKGLLIEKAPPEKFFTQPDSERVRQFLQSSR